VPEANEAAAEIEEVRGWAAGLEALHARIAGRFVRAEPRRRVLAYLRGLVSNVGRKNGWQLAEHAGEATPDGMQRLLATADWDPDLVRDDLRGYVVEHLGDPQAVLVVDETGFLKKGTTSVGVQRQYSGTAGKVDNCQLGVFLAYASSRGRAFIDRELYLPKAWTEDRARCRAARVPEEVGFQTKPQLARVLVQRALDAGVPASWVTADEVYGQDPAFRVWLEGRQMAHVLAIKSSELLAVGDGPAKRSAAQLAAAVPAEHWVGASAGHGAKGRRLYDWTRTQLPHQPLADGSAGCWSGAAAATASWPFTPASPRSTPHWWGWSGWPGSGGQSRTAPEIRRLLVALVWTAPIQPSLVLTWSRWRRRHQARARRAHYQRRERQVRLEY
jgi:SRSO17 transposase